MLSVPVISISDTNISYLTDKICWCWIQHKAEGQNKVILILIISKHYESDTFMDGL